MKRLYLSPAEKAFLEREHDESVNRKQGDRIKAILLRSEGWTVPQISQALRVHQSTIIKHIQDYKERGKLENESGGSASHLSDEQTAELIAHLEEYTYAYSHQILLTIKERFGITYTVAGLTHWLHRHGFSYKKPKGVPHKADSELQQQFIAEYEQLKQKVRQDTPILFMDSVHPTQATKISYGWIRKGHTKEINTTASRTRMNLIGAIECGHLERAITASYDTINANAIIDFMAAIKSQYPTAKDIHLILDQAGYHRAQSVI